VRLAGGLLLAVATGWTLSCRAPEAQPAQPSAALAAVDSGDYPLVLFNDATYVELAVGEARGLFLFDTGANTSGIDGGWLAKAGVRGTFEDGGQLAGTTGVRRVQKVVLPRLGLGTGYFLEPRFVVSDYRAFAHPPAGRQVGLLGTDLLVNYEVSIDYRARRARLALRNERRERSGAWQATGLTYPLNLPTVNARLGGVDMPCRLDSGASYLEDRPYLDGNVAALRALRAAGHELHQVGSLRVRGVTGGQTLKLYQGGLSLEVGPRRIDDVILVVHPSGSLARKDPLLLAGGTIISRWERVVLDPFDRLLWLPVETPTD